VDGSKVDGMIQAGRIAEVCAYCECDVVNTYRVWLRYSYNEDRPVQVMRLADLIAMKRVAVEQAADGANQAAVGAKHQRDLERLQAVAGYA
jgi:Predicted 3'-5' exonuclease related to the exonuclease domain of PolB